MNFRIGGIAAIGLAAYFAGGHSASALLINPFDNTQNNSVLINSLLAPGSMLAPVGGTDVFVGAKGAPTSGQSQSATYSGLNLISHIGGPTISNVDGIMLTSGTSSIPFINTDSSFDPFIPGTGTDAEMNAILQAAGNNQSTNDRNFLQFNFTVPTGQTSIKADFVYGSDEYPDQGVTDAFLFIVDGTNYAYFPDSSLVSFVLGNNAANFVSNNFNGAYDIEYDGLSKQLLVVGLLNPNLTIHTLKIAVADTADSIFDSGVFIGGLRTGTETGGGVKPPEPEDVIPEPVTASLSGLALLALAGMVTRRSR